MRHERLDKIPAYSTPPKILSDVHATQFHGSANVLPADMADRDIFPVSKPEPARALQIHLCDAVIVPFGIAAIHLLRASGESIRRQHDALLGKLA